MDDEGGWREIDEVADCWSVDCLVSWVLKICDSKCLETPVNYDKALHACLGC